MFTRQEIPSLKRPIYYSVIGHLIFIIFCTLVSHFTWPFKQRPVDLVWVELPRGTSEEVDTGMKQSEGLPKSTIQEQKQLFKSPPQPDEKAMKEPVTKVKKQTEKKVEKKKPKDKIDTALAKIDKMLKTRDVRPEAAQIGQSGEGFKYGTGDKPVIVPRDDVEYLKYQAIIRMRIINEWIVPPKYIEQPSSIAQYPSLIVMINEEGEVISTQWETQSGDKALDASCLRAVYRAAPFDSPPERLKWEAYNEGFTVSCKPR